MSRPLSWVVGAGGLLGSNVQRSLAGRGRLWQPPRRLSWDTANACSDVLSTARSFSAETRGGPWQVAWCAGRGVPGSSEESLQREEAVFLALLEGLEAAPRNGALFLSSSAGGVYAGSSQPPFTESTVPRPLSPYGESKLRLEEAARQWGADTDRSVVIGRLSNLYGVGQDLAKAQGLISHLCRAQLLRRPVTVYVSMDTVRDYLWAQDAGEMVAAMLGRALTLTTEGSSATVTKVLAAQRGTTVAGLIAELRRVSGRTPQVIHAASPAAAWQPKDLRVRSLVWTDLSLSRPTPLPVGVAMVLRSLQREQQLGRL